MVSDKREWAGLPVRLLRGIALTALATSAFILALQAIIGVRYGSDRVKQIQHLQAREVKLYQALARKDSEFETERRTYAERLKTRDELLRQRDQVIVLLKARLAGYIQLGGENPASD